MAIEIDSIEILKEHINGVMMRADHHARNVYKAVMPLVGLVAWKADKIKARTTNGEHGNMIWFYVNSKKYAMKFNHDQHKIEILKDKQNGDLVAQFDNNSSVDYMIQTFNSL